MRAFDFTEVLIALVRATGWTVVLSLVAFAGGGILGLVLTMMRVSKNRLLQSISRFYIAFVQGTPLLMQLFLIFFGIPILLGFDVPAFVSASVALIAYAAAYLADIWRGSVEAIPKAQWEAGTSLGLSWLQQFRHVILPQAVKVSIPPTVGFAVQVIKNTSLTSIIGYVELTRQGQILNNVTFQPFVIFAMVGAIYFIVCYPLSLYSQRLEARLTIETR
ncbi:MAG TPA: amino acid ABC transporter permease [Anaerolineales bacterium]|nr:amino acid ABC transporter permease [Anaerolineales bacterium]HRF48177.1 amino acid ABC transporter permease [Anaerolineales bacterium]